ncbi:MAG: tetratricopeptide repeat protein, partial [Rhodospirillaceae bacterium]
GSAGLGGRDIGASVGGGGLAPDGSIPGSEDKAGGPGASAAPAAKAPAKAKSPVIEFFTNRFNTAMEKREFHAAIKAVNDVMLAGGADQVAMDNLARSLLMGYMPAAAMMVLEWAIEKFPQSPRLLFRLAITQTELGQLDRAVELFDKAIQLNPKPPEFHMGLSDALLLKGDWARGLTEYEWRYEIMHGRKILEPFSDARWHGEPAKGKRILVYGEQGYGDTFQFCRYLPMVKALGADLTFGVSPELKSVVSGVAGPDRITTTIPPHDAYDYHSPVSSLPRVLGTRIDTIPGDVPYIKVDPARAATWKARLESIPRPRVALTWAGRPTHPRNHNRSISLDKFEVLAPLGPFLSVSPVRHSKSELSARGSRIKIREFGSRLRDFADTAASMQQIDLLITVDT